jgi:hypothetical protein
MGTTLQLNVEFTFSFLLHSSILESKLCSAPMPTFCIVPDGIISSHPDPVRNGAILLLLLCQLLLNPECFLGRHGADKPTSTQVTRGEQTPLQNTKHVRDRMRMERRRNEGENPRVILCRRPNPNPSTFLRHRSLASHGPSSRHI